MRYESFRRYASDSRRFDLCSVRSTNVYEEKSLGVFADDESSIDEEDFTPTGNRATIWSRYLTMHMRRQLSFGESTRHVRFSVGD